MRTPSTVPFMLSYGNRSDQSYGLQAICSFQSEFLVGRARLCLRRSRPRAGPGKPSLCFCPRGAGQQRGRGGPITGAMVWAWVWSPSLHHLLPCLSWALQLVGDPLPPGPKCLWLHSWAPMSLSTERYEPESAAAHRGGAGRAPRAPCPCRAAGPSRALWPRC